MKTKTKQTNQLIKRDQSKVDSMAANIEIARQGLQRLINEAGNIGAEVTAENWPTFLRTPEKTATEQITKDLPTEMIGGFAKKKASVIAELELPNMDELVNEAETLTIELKRRGIAQNMLTVQGNEALRNENSFKDFVDTCSIYATDPELWEMFKAFEKAFNDLNQAATKRRHSGIHISNPRPFFGWFTFDESGKATANPDKYKSMAAN
jgi:hypothetical protein